MLLVGVLALTFSSIAPAVAGKAMSTTTTVHDFHTGAVEPGSATLVRTDNDLHLRWKSTVEPGTYTVWWIIWNDPSACTGACGEDDVFTVPGFALYPATGHIVGGSGKANFGAGLREGASGSIFGIGELTDARAAEVHVVLLYHDELDPDRLPEAIQTFLGECEAFGGPTGNFCEDFQFAVFK